MTNQYRLATGSASIPARSDDYDPLDYEEQMPQPLVGVATTEANGSSHSFWPSPMSWTNNIVPFDPTQSFADNADFDIGEEEKNEFPLHCLPEGMKSMVDEVCRAMLTPVALNAACALGAISAALGAGLEVATGGGGFLRGNLFIAAIAKSGTGKGRSFDVITNPWQQFEEDIIHEWNTSIRPALDSSITVLEQELKVLKNSICRKDYDRDKVESEITQLTNKLQSQEAKRFEPRLITADATKEALAERLSHGKNEAIASMSGEARGCVDVLAGRYNKKTDEDIYISGYSGDSIKVDRINRPAIRLRRPCLSVLWLFQPDKMYAWLSNDSLTLSGLLPRFLIFISRAEPQLEPEQRHCVDEAVKSQWRTLIQDLGTAFHQAGSAFKISPSEGVHQVFRDYSNELVHRRRSGGDLSDVNEYVSRWAENAWRLALVLHAGQHGKDSAMQAMSLETANNAITLMKWFAEQQLDILSAGREKIKTDRLANLSAVLSTKPNYACTLRDLNRRHSFDRDEVKALVVANPDKLRLQKTSPSGGGRPSETVQWINP